MDVSVDSYASELLHTMKKPLQSFAGRWRKGGGFHSG